jgi:hypothetical protein
VFQDPVVAQDGLTYEAAELQRYWQEHPGQSPLVCDPGSGLPKKLDMAVVPNVLVRYLVAMWLEWREGQKAALVRSGHGPATPSLGQPQVNSFEQSGQ